MSAKLPGAPRPVAADARRPAFAEGFPRVPELDALVSAFARGDYARVRSEAPRLASSAESEDVRSAAKELRARIEPDKLARGLFALTALLLVVLSVWWWAHNGPPPAPPPIIEHID